MHWSLNVQYCLVDPTLYMCFDCMCVRMYLTYVCMYACWLVCTYTYCSDCGLSLCSLNEYVSLRMDVGLCTYVSTYVCMYTCMYYCMYLDLACICVRIYLTYVCTYVPYVSYVCTLRILHMYLTYLTYVLYEAHLVAFVYQST